MKLVVTDILMTCWNCGGTGWVLDMPCGVPGCPSQLPAVPNEGEVIRAMTDEAYTGMKIARQKFLDAHPAATLEESFRAGYLAAVRNKRLLEKIFGPRQDMCNILGLPKDATWEDIKDAADQLVRSKPAD